MSAKNPLTETEKSAAEWADKLTLENCLKLARELREDETTVRAEAVEQHAKWRAVTDRIEAIQVKIAALKYRLERDL